MGMRCKQKAKHLEVIRNITYMYMYITWHELQTTRAISWRFKEFAFEWLTNVRCESGFVWN